MMVVDSRCDQGRAAGLPAGARRASGCSLAARAKEDVVLISKQLAKAFNEQIGHELGASLQYVSIAAYFQQRHLTLLAKLFFKQADEEKEHAMKFVRYLLDTKAELRIPAIPAPPATFASAEAAAQSALDWELTVTKQISALTDIAVKDNDYLAQGFLQWFVDEQLEEVVKMERLLGVIRQSGDRNLLMVEAYLVHIEKAD
jgi:bacterioferritin B